MFWLFKYALSNSEIAVAQNVEITGHVTNCCKRPLLVGETLNKCGLEITRKATEKYLVYVDDNFCVIELNECDKSYLGHDFCFLHFDR